MTRPFARITVGLLTVIGLTACDATIGTGPAGAIPVVQTLLVAGDSLQTAWVEWRTPADSAFTPDVRPVSPSVVDLWLILPTGDSAGFAPVAGVPGRFDATAVAVAGDAYLLRGTVAGHAVSAATTVPDQIDIRTPAADTIAISGGCGFLCPLSYRWFAGGTAAYLYEESQVGSPIVLLLQSTRDTVGVIQLLPAQDTTKLAVFALDAHAASFLLPTTPKSSITGVFGLFGAASRAERWIVWQ